MKKLILYTSLIAFFLISCQKDILSRSNEIPEWLKEDIHRQEQTIKDSPELMNSYGAWLRYQWHDDYYFEYHNDLSSNSPKATSYDGTVHIEVWDVTTDYYKEKCCKAYIWKAPKARDY